MKNKSTLDQNMIGPASDYKAWTDLNTSSDIGNALSDVDEGYWSAKILINEHQSNNKKEKGFRLNMQELISNNLIWKDLFWLWFIKKIHVFNGLWEVSVVFRFQVEWEGWIMSDYVFKTCNLDDNNSSSIPVEAEWFRRWKNAWVDVIDVIKEWELDLVWKKYPYIILPYLSNEYDLDGDNIEWFYNLIWKNLAKMHTVKWNWYGNIRRNSDWEFIWNKDKFVLNTSLESDVKVLIDNAIFDSDTLVNTINKCKSIIETDISDWQTMSWIHWDVNVSNYFKTKPNWITIYDSEPRLDHPMLDLWLTIFKNTIWEYEELNKKKLEKAIRDWYEKNGWIINDKVMYACLFLSWIKKWTRAYRHWILRWWKTNKYFESANRYFNKLSEISERL